jgi:hypothetical protein
MREVTSQTVNGLYLSDFSFRFFFIVEYPVTIELAINSANITLSVRMKDVICSRVTCRSILVGVYSTFLAFLLHKSSLPILRG